MQVKPDEARYRTGGDEMDLKEMAKERVCTRCGGRLEIVRIQGDAVDSPFCRSCSRTNWGCLPDVYDMARHFVSKCVFEYYSADSILDDGDRMKANIGEIADIITWVREYDENVAKEKYEEMTARLNKLAQQRK